MIELPEQPARPAPTDFLRKRDIRADKVTAMMEALEYAWASTGANIGTFELDWSTSSTSYTTINDAGNGLDLDQLNPLISPNRAEIGPLATSTGAFIVEVQVFGRDVEVEANLHRDDDSGFIPAAATESGVVSIADDWQWRSVYLLLNAEAVLGNKDCLLKLRARHAQGGTSEASIRSVAVNEIRHVNLAYERLGDLAIYGSEWVGPYADNEQVDAWDSDGAAGTLSVSSGSPTMARDALSTGVHTVDFDPSSSTDTLESDTSFDLSTSDGFLFACAVKLDVQDTTRLIFQKVGGSQGYAFVLYCDGSTIAGEIQDGGYRNVSTPLGAGQWVDCAVRWRKSDALLELWVNGTRVDTSIGTPGAPLDDSVGVMRMGSFQNGLYPFDGQAAMPLLLEGSYTSGQVQHLMQWRRSLHGLF